MKFAFVCDEHFCYILTFSCKWTHCGLVKPIGDINCGQHWLRWWLVAWRHKAFTWTNVDISLVRFCGIHLRAELLICIMRGIYRYFRKYCLEANEFSHRGWVMRICVNKLDHAPLIQIMACHLYGTNTLSELLLAYHLFGTNFNEILFKI